MRANQAVTNSRKRPSLWFVAILAIWFVVAVLTSFQGYLAGIAADQPQPWLPAFGYGLLWYGVWAVLTPLVVLLARRIRRIDGSIGWPIFAHGTAALMISAVHASLYALILSPLLSGPASPSAIDILVRKLSGSIHVNLMIYSIIVAIVLGAQAYRALRDRDVHAAHLETQLAEADSASLRARLQPHFLFNSLNAISALIPEDPRKSQRLIASLGDLLRMSIDQHRSPTTTLFEEMAFTEAYLVIEQARLGDRLTIDTQIAPEAMSATIPTLLLQPLVENSIRHGLSTTARGGKLTIGAHVSDGNLNLVVADDGRGTSSIIEGVGLGSARERLVQMYGARHSMVIKTAEGGGFQVSISVPQ